MKRSYFLIYVLAFVVCAAAGIPATAKSSADSENFVRNASIGNTFEVESSKLALQKSQNADVKAFAKRMVDDHSQAQSKLKTAAANVDASLVGNKLDNKHQDILDKLKDDSGASFDKQYIKAQTDAHDEAVDLFRDYSKNGDDTKLKDFATKTLPTLEDHKKHVAKLKM